MKTRVIASWFIFTLLSVCKVHGRDLDLDRNQYYIAPEWYRVKREKKGGAVQDGNLWGVRIGCDRLKRYSWYAGAEASYAYGHLNGHVGSGDKITSHFTDALLEGRFGYTFQQKCGWKAALTPFVGIGYLMEKNHFVKPSELHIHFQTHCPYAATGFLSRVYLWEQFEAGLNLKVRFPFEPRCHTSHDEDHENCIQNIKERIQYRIELPFTYRFSCDGPWAVSLTPFFEYRRYGSHPNFPFNFFRTKFTIWGAMVALEYQR